VAGSGRQPVGEADGARSCEIGEVRGRLTGGPHGTVTGAEVNLIQPKFQTDLNYIQIRSNIDRSKIDLPELQKFEKYGFKDLKRMNNFLHTNFFRFRRDLE
jgi:hypothetical protein